MRTLETIEQDINRCKAQIAHTYNSEKLSPQEAFTLRQGYQKQLQNLQNEFNKTRSWLNIEVIDPRIVKNF
jgi:hypothetical protein